MYKHILITLDNSPVDRAVLTHIRPLARLTNAQITLIHVADGFMARNQKNLGESPEMQEDRAYLQRCQDDLRSDGFNVTAVLACGDPVKEILATIDKGDFDLVAMTGHGHRGLADLVLGSVSRELLHRAPIPVLMVPQPA